MGKLIVLSPHFDDAALSAGQLIAGHHSPIIVTVCSSEPQMYSALTEYDKNCGFEEIHQVISARREENRVACQILRARSVELGLYDNQYHSQPVELYEDAFREYLSSKSRRDDMVVAPLATKHPDHQKVMKASLDVCRRMRFPLWLYEELPHRVLWPEEVTKTVESLKQEGISLLREFIGDGHMQLKEAAVNCYRSQLWSLDLRSTFVPERFHKVVFE